MCMHIMRRNVCFVEPFHVGIVYMIHENLLRQSQIWLWPVLARALVKTFLKDSKKTFIHKMISCNKNGRRVTTTQEHMIVQANNKQRKEQPTAAAATVENSLWDSHHTTIVEMAPSHFARWTDELKQNDKQNETRPKRCSEICKRKTNKRQNNRSRFPFSQRQLMHITRWPRLGNVFQPGWLNDATAPQHMYTYGVFFASLIFVFMSNFENYRMTKSNQMDAHFTFMFPFGSADLQAAFAWFIAIVVLLGAIIFSHSPAQLWDWFGWE